MKLTINGQEYEIGSRADLSGANLRGADLREANLREANLVRANLRGANLVRANLYEANLREADLRGANLYEANLREADLRGANLREAVLHEANLCGAKDIDPLAYAQTLITPEGDITGYKKLRDGTICKLRIPAEARRHNATGRKCRAEYAVVLEGEGVTAHAKIAIDKGIPLPDLRSGEKGRPSKYPWHDMDVGDSFFIPYASRLYSLVGMSNKRHAPKRFTQHYEQNERGVFGMRIWRTE